jgi:hypothetical protein
MQLSQDQIEHFKTFGFLVLRSYFSEDEVATIWKEYKYRSAIAESYIPFDGTKRHDMNMMGSVTPFFSSLLDNRNRFLGLAEQLIGRVLGMSAAVSRHITNTYWHYDSTTYELPGLQFASYLIPVRADTGALRVIPGSHLQPFHNEIGAIRTCDYAWIRQDNQVEACALVDSMPSFVCETDPRDVIVFDLRIYHASVGGSNDRPRMGVGYRIYPRTPRETAGMIWESKHVLQEQDNSESPWDPKFAYPPEWVDDPAGPSVRREWVAEYRRFGEMDEKETGFQTVGREGKLWVEPLEARN